MVLSVFVINLKSIAMLQRVLSVIEKLIRLGLHLKTMMLLVDGEMNMTEKFRLIPQGRCLMEIRSRLQWNSKRLSFGERISSLAASQKSYLHML